MLDLSYPKVRRIKKTKNITIAGQNSKTGFVFQDYLAVSCFIPVIHLRM